MNRKRRGLRGAARSRNLSQEAPEPEIIEINTEMNRKRRDLRGAATWGGSRVIWESHLEGFGVHLWGAWFGSDLGGGALRLAQGGGRAKVKRGGFKECTFRLFDRFS